MNNSSRLLRSIIASAVLATLFVLVACGGGGGGNDGTSSYTVSGTVTGLSGTGLVLQNNGGDDLTISADGSFTFSAEGANGASYSVAVLTQPTGPVQTCTVNTGSGKISGANITNVSVVCSTNTYIVSGTVSGLSGYGLVLQNNGANDLAISTDGSFSFTAPVASGANHNVTILSQPSGPSQTCTINGGTGMVTNANISNVTVACSTNTYTVSGTVTGLLGAGTVLQNNGGDDLDIASDGSFIFTTPVVSGANYSVTVKTQPSGPAQTCTVNTGNGMVLGADITNVVVVCATNTYTVSGSVTGLAGTGLVLQNNGTNDLAIAADGTFNFTVPVASGANYNVTAKTQPSGPAQTCTVNSGTGMVTNANISGVTVTCSTNTYTYTVSGTVNGLLGAGLVLQNNGGDDLNITADGSFVFPTSVVSGTSYNVTVKTQPSVPAQVCTVNTGSGSISGADITNVSVVCSTSTYTVSGTVYGLFGTGLVLQNNGAADLAISADGSFSFAIPVASGANYNVTVKSHPSGYVQTCTVNDGAGMVTNADISSVTVNCAVNTYAVSGTVIGLLGAGLVLQNNGADDLAISSDGRFSFAARVASSASYNVTVKTQPSGPAQTCTASNFANTEPISIMIDTFTVTCAATSYTVGGTVTGLVGAGLVLQNNGSDFLRVDANGSFTFTTPVAAGADYRIQVKAQPSAPDQICTVSAGVGAATGNISSVSVACTTYIPRYAYVTNAGSNDISQYTIGADGSLTTMASATVAAGTSPQSVAVDPSGRYVYVANYGSSNVSQYMIGTDGSLTAMTTATVAAGTNPYSVAVDPSGRYVYVANYTDGTVSQYTIGADGSLTAMTTATVAAGTNPRCVAVDTSGRYVYVANFGSGSISQYNIGSDGSLTPMVSPSFAAFSPKCVVLHPSGQYAYVSHGMDFISIYIAGPDGTLSSGINLPPPPAGGISGTLIPWLQADLFTHTVAAAADPTGKYVYVAVAGMGNGVWQFSLGMDGLPARVPTIATAGSYPIAVTVDPSGKYVYVANYGSGSVSQYTIDADGSLTQMAAASIAAGTNPTSIVTVASRQ